MIKAEYFGISEEDLKSTFGPRARDAVKWNPDSTWYFNNEQLANLISLLSKAKRGTQNVQPQL
jgi:hypothetical protein